MTKRFSRERLRNLLRLDDAVARPRNRRFAQAIGAECNELQTDALIDIMVERLWHNDLSVPLISEAEYLRFVAATLEKCEVELNEEAGNVDSNEDAHLARALSVCLMQRVKNIAREEHRIHYTEPTPAVGYDHIRARLYNLDFILETRKKSIDYFLSLDERRQSDLDDKVDWLAFSRNEFVEYWLVYEKVFRDAFNAKSIIDDLIPALSKADGMTDEELAERMREPEFPEFRQQLIAEVALSLFPAVDSTSRAMREFIESEAERIYGAASSAAI